MNAVTTINVHEMDTTGDYSSSYRYHPAFKAVTTAYNAGDSKMKLLYDKESIPDLHAFQSELASELGGLKPETLWPFPSHDAAARTYANYTNDVPLMLFVIDLKGSDSPYQKAIMENTGPALTFII